MKINDTDLIELGFVHYDQMGDSAFFYKIITKEISFLCSMYKGVFSELQIAGFESGKMNYPRLDFKIKSIDDLKDVIGFFDKNLL